MSPQSSRLAAVISPERLTTTNSAPDKPRMLFSTLSVNGNDVTARVSLMSRNWDRMRSIACRPASQAFHTLIATTVASITHAIGNMIGISTATAS
jgi:hypothetical protein